MEALSIKLTPRCSLSAEGLRWCLAGTGALILIPTLICLAQRWWGVLPFTLIEFGIFAWALRWNAARALDYHLIAISENTVRVTIHERRQLDRTVEFARHWTRARLARSARRPGECGVWIESQGHRCEVAAFLREPERRKLADSLQSLIGAMGECPPLPPARDLINGT